jgi:hypothetical protein
MNRVPRTPRDPEALLEAWAELSARARTPDPGVVRGSGRRGLLAAAATATAAVVLIAFVGVLLVLRGMPGAMPALPATPEPGPAATSERDGIRIELWLDQRAVRLGDQLIAGVRVTNTGTAALEREGNDCPTGPAMVRVLAQGGLPGRRWDGIAAEFKRLVLVEAGVVDEDGQDVLGVFRDVRFVGGFIPIACPGASFRESFEPGDVLESNVVWTAVPAGGRTPRTGPAVVAASFSWASGEVTAEVDIELVAGQPQAEKTLADYVDAALSNEDFRRWLDGRPRSSWSDTHTVRWPTAQGEYPPLPAYEGISGPVIEVGLFREAGDAFELGAVIVDVDTAIPIATRFEP